MAQKYIISPLEHLLSLERPSLHMFPGAADWPSKNLTINQKRLKKRWGYSEYRDLAANVQGIHIYQEKDGTRHTMYLTDTDLCERKASTDETWKYLTEIITYSSEIDEISGTTVTLKTGEAPDATDGIEDGDYFILANDFTANKESHLVLAYDAGDDGSGNIPDPGDTVTGGTSGATAIIKLLPTYTGTFAGGNAAGDLILTAVTGAFLDNETLTFEDTETALANGTGSATWAAIASVDDGPPPTITLDNDYPGSTGDWTGSERTGYVRKVYSTPKASETIPTSGRWNVAAVADKFCFTNADINAQYWGVGSTYAAALNATYATNAKYCIEYGNRLCLANLKVSGGGTFAPWTLRCSANGDPTKYSTEDTTAVDYEFIDTDDVISGLGKVGASLVVYKTDSLLIGHLTGVATDPFRFPIQKRGIGCIAPYSIVPVRGTNMFLGRDDFYVIEGDHPSPIGEGIRYQFFDIVSETEAENVWGFVNTVENEVVWIANTSQGKWAFVYDYKDREWGAYWYSNDISGAGKGDTT